MEQLFERIVEMYADVKGIQGGTLGDAAKRELFALHNLAIGEVAPEIEGEDIDGRPMKLSDYRGKVVVLNFWSHEYCATCRGMYPHERSLVKRLKGKPFALLGISRDPDREKLKKVQVEEKLSWRAWWDGGDTDSPIHAKWNVNVWPTIYVLDDRGVIRYKDVFEEDLDQAVDTLLRELEAEKKPQREFPDKAKAR